jgi:hypothetical protein
LDGHLCQLFQEVARHSAGERDHPCLDSYIGVAQLPVTGCAQGALDTLGKAKILHALLQKRCRKSQSFLIPAGAITGW